MTLEQEIHLGRIKNEFDGRVDVKFRKGAEEHGGDLRDMSPLQLAENALDECVDQFTYLLTLRDQLRAIADAAPPRTFSPPRPDSTA